MILQCLWAWVDLPLAPGQGPRTVFVVTGGDELGRGGVVTRLEQQLPQSSMPAFVDDGRSVLVSRPAANLPLLMPARAPLPAPLRPCLRACTTPTLTHTFSLGSGFFSPSTPVAAPHVIFALRPPPLSSSRGGSAVALSAGEIAEAEVKAARKVITRAQVLKFMCEGGQSGHEGQREGSEDEEGEADEVVDAGAVYTSMALSAAAVAMDGVSGGGGGTAGGHGFPLELRGAVETPYALDVADPVDLTWWARSRGANKAFVLDTRPTTHARRLPPDR